MGRQCYERWVQKEIIQVEESAIRVVLPMGYGGESSRRYPLLIMLTPDLDVTESLRTLHSEGVLPEMIVATLLGKSSLDDPAALVPILSGKFQLLDSPAARWIVGTGHSAVTAMNAVLDHPGMFGKGAFLSTSFEGIEGAPPLHSPVLRSLEERAIFPKNTRLFFDYGTVGLDECYEPYHRDLGAILRGKGWKDGRGFQIKRSPGGSHDPDSWGMRLVPALRWLASH